jgi:hypothetical protein
MMVQVKIVRTPVRRTDMATVDWRGDTGKVADAELLFTDGPLAGLKLAGFTVYQNPRTREMNVTFPARSYEVNREKRSYKLLRGTTVEDEKALKNLIIDAYEELIMVPEQKKVNPNGDTTEDLSG